MVTSIKHRVKIQCGCARLEGMNCPMIPTTGKKLCRMCIYRCRVDKKTQQPKVLPGQPALL